MSEQQPELRWAPLPPKPSRRGRIWLISGLVIAALIIAGIVLFLLVPRGGAPEPETSATPTPTNSASPSATPSAGTEPTDEPTTPPVTTPPPPADPNVETFRGQVSGWLVDAGRGLDIVASSSGQDALTVIDTLQEDAQRLSDSQPPSSISDPWRDGVAVYAQRLAELRSAVTAGSGVSAAVDAARAASGDLKAIVGL